MVEECPRHSAGTDGADESTGKSVVQFWADAWTSPRTRVYGPQSSGVRAGWGPQKSLPVGEADLIASLSSCSLGKSRGICMGVCVSIMRGWLPSLSGVSTAPKQVDDVPNTKLGRKWFESHILIY